MAEIGFISSGETVLRGKNQTMGEVKLRYYVLFRMLKNCPV